MAKSKKEKTTDQAEAMQAKAVRFLRDVVGDEDKADEIEGLTVSEYADRKGLVLTNPATKRSEKAMSEEDYTDSRTKAEIIADEEEALETLDNAWNRFVDVDESWSKEQLLEAIEEACQDMNDFDSDRFPIDEPEGDDQEEDQAA